jgi:hypothetical protein
MVKALRHSLNYPVYMNTQVPDLGRRKSKSLQGISDFIRNGTCSSQSKSALKEKQYVPL